MPDLPRPAAPTKICQADWPPLAAARQATSRRFYDAYPMMKTRQPEPGSRLAASRATPALYY
jgi:hypothetical protein